MSEEQKYDPEHIDGQLPQLQDIFPDELFQKIKKKIKEYQSIK